MSTAGHLNGTDSSPEDVSDDTSRGVMKHGTIIERTTGALCGSEALDWPTRAVMDGGQVVPAGQECTSKRPLAYVGT